MNSHLSDIVTFSFEILIFLKNFTVHKRGKSPIISFCMLFLEDKSFSFDHFKHIIREVPFCCLKRLNKKYYSTFSYSIKMETGGENEH